MNKKKKNNQQKKQVASTNEIKTAEKKSELEEKKLEDKKLEEKELDEKELEKIIEENVENEMTEKITDKLIRFMKRAKNASPDGKKAVMIAGVKVVLPVLATVIVIATIVSLVKTKNEKQDKEAVVMTEASTEAAVEPLEVDAHQDVNTLMTTYYNALSSCDLETVQSVMENISETDLIQLKSKNEFVESYNNITCYTRSGIIENSYFVYVTYDAKFNDFDALVPGVTAHYVYTAEDGSLKIAKEMDEQVNAALMLSTCQDDVVDIFNKVDVEYKELLATNEELNTFMTEMTSKAKTMAGEEIALLEADKETASVEETTEAEVAEAVEEQPQSQVVNEEVKATATVNVRSSDSENADKVGRVETGTVLTRVEDKINGWSKVIYDGKEAYIKSDYLEVVAVNTVEETADDTEEAVNTESTQSKVTGTVTARTNVNVRNEPSTTADTIGKAEGGVSYKVLEDQGEWLKIEYKGQTGFVKAEFFD